MCVFVSETIKSAYLYCMSQYRPMHGDFKLALMKKSRLCRGTFACANQADRCMILLHCAQRSTPWLLDTRGFDRNVECFSLFERYVTLPVGTWLIALEQSPRSQCGRLLRTSQSHYFILRGENKQTLSVVSLQLTVQLPCRKVLLLLHLTFKSMPKAKFWRCQHCRGRSRKRCQQSTSGPITAKP